jgi:hypothetical protein
MWKVVVIICALGNPCMVFQEDPVKYYDDKVECMVVAAEKERLLIEAHKKYDYQVEKHAHTCELKENIDSA